MSVFHVVEGVSALVWGGVNQSCECGAGFRERESLLRSLERARGVLCGENRVSVRGSRAGTGGRTGCDLSGTRGFCGVVCGGRVGRLPPSPCGGSVVMRGPRGFGTGSWRQSDPLVHRPPVSGVSLWVGDANAYLTL